MNNSTFLKQIIISVITALFIIGDFITNDWVFAILNYDLILVIAYNFFYKDHLNVKDAYLLFIKLLFVILFPFFQLLSIRFFYESTYFIEHIILAKLILLIIIIINSTFLKSIVNTKDNTESDIKKITLDQIITLNQLINSAVVGFAPLSSLNPWNQFYSRKLSRLRIKERLKKGFYSFKCPDIVAIGRTFQAKCIVAKKEQLLLKEQISSLNIKNIEVGNIMKVKLEGSKFEITELNNSSQFILENKTTNWEWLVTPNSSGKHDLRLLVSIKISSQISGEAFLDYPINIKNIQVKWNPIFATKYFLNRNWQWLIGFFAGSGLVWRLIEYIIK